MRRRTLGAACVALGLAACGARPEPPLGEALLAEWTLAVELAPGEERIDCAWFVIPPTGLAVERVEHALGAGLHHLIVFPTALGPGDVTGPDGALASCTLADVADTTGFALGAQPGGDALTYPDGAALWFPPDQVVMVQVHALATGARPLATRAVVRLFGTRSPPVREAGTLHFYDWAIAVPPRSAATTRARCVLPEAVELAFGHGHFHRAGRLRAWVRGAAGPGAPFLDVSRGDHPSLGLPAPVRVEAGEAIEFECEHDNPGDTWVFEGQSARDDEMCSLTAAYVADDGRRLGAGAEGCAAAGSGVLGQGSAGCASVEPCAAGADPTPAGALARCLLDTSEAASLAFQAHTACRARHCAAPCGVAPAQSWLAHQGGEAGCQGCLAQHCAAAPCAP